MMLEGKTALITGATGGFGRRLAEAYAAEGAMLILHGRNAGALAALNAKLGGKHVLFAQDLRGDITGLAPLFQNHGLDILVNNAAEQGPVGKTWEVPTAEWVQAIEIDLLVPFVLSQLAIPFMIKRGGGKIINVSGGGATGPRPNYSAYAAAKTALVRFTECLAEETKELHIDVNAIAPGVMPTRMHPARTPGMPEDPFAEPAALCVFLASHASNGISGKLISAVWDDWRNLKAEALDKDIYTLRRIVAKGGV